MYMTRINEVRCTEFKIDQEGVDENVWRKERRDKWCDYSIMSKSKS